MCQHFMPELPDHIGNGNGQLQPEVIVSHKLKPGDAARGCEIFRRKQQACRKVIPTT